MKAKTEIKINHTNNENRILKRNKQGGRDENEF